MFKLATLIGTLLLTEGSGSDLNLDLTCPQGWIASSFNSYKCSFPDQSDERVWSSWKSDCFACLTCLSNSTLSLPNGVVEVCLVTQSDVSTQMETILQVQKQSLSCALNDEFCETLDSLKFCGVSVPIVGKSSSKNKVLPCKEIQKEAPHESFELICPKSFVLQSIVFRSYTREISKFGHSSCIKCLPKFEATGFFTMILACYQPQPIPSHTTFYNNGTESPEEPDISKYSSGRPICGAKFLTADNFIKTWDYIPCQDEDDQQTIVSKLIIRTTYTIRGQHNDLISN